LSASSVLLTVAYDGGAFAGWAAQKDARTVQGVLLEALAGMDPSVAAVRGASRTDAGVHAEAQLAAFDPDPARAIDARGWVLGLDSKLPDDVAVRAARTVPLGYDPRTMSRGKRYRYRLLLDQVRDPLLRGRAWRLGYDLDLERMAREAQRAEGTHDFRAFRSAHDARQNTVRTLSRVAIERESERIVSIAVSGTAFMHNMVRILVGTLVDVARGQLDEGTVTHAIASGDRADLGPTAPAHGLCLERIDAAIPEGSGVPWPR
jgi:tRNA pseudouridine38-40 synthase